MTDEEYVRSRWEMVDVLCDSQHSFPGCPTLRAMIILLRSEPGDETAPVYKRTIGRLQAHLDELKKGLKG